MAVLGGANADDNRFKLGAELSDNAKMSSMEWLKAANKNSA